ncbi:MAG: magnesium transporter [Ruminococcaceae bacterium]|nr:magnesium transporter [Oscillospiraceae bacterium]
MEVDVLKNLLKQKRYSELKEMFKNKNSADISAALDELDSEELILIYRLIAKQEAAKVFSYMEPDTQEKLITYMTDKELKETMDEMFVDDAVDMIEEMPSNVVKRILRHTPPEQREIINMFLRYPSGSAGSVMTIEFIDLKAYMTVAEAFAKIKKVGVDSETIYTCYVLDEERTLIGIISVKTMLLADSKAKIVDLMETNFICVNTLDDKENAARKFDKYDLLALPVVDMESKMVGIITVDDAVDVLKEETTEDIEKMAAISPSDASYFKMSILTHAKNRILWLIVLMLSASITGGILTKYQNAFSAVPLLVSFIPMLMNTGGNCGNQSASLIIRGIALEEIMPSDFFRALFKEFGVSLLVAMVLSLINGLRIFIVYRDAELMIVITLTLIFTVILSKVLGCVLPILAKKLRLDPALMATPLITTIVDACSMVIYFNIALMIMGKRIG